MLNEENQTGEKLDRLIASIDRLQQTLERAPVAQSVDLAGSAINIKPDAATAVSLRKRHTDMPAFLCLGPTTLAIRAGTSLDAGSWGLTWDRDTIIEMPSQLMAGQDYLVVASPAPEGKLQIVPNTGERLDTNPVAIGGFHFAPGGNAEFRSGGNEESQISPYSIWDLNFRPSCADPRGMVLVDGRFWADIYLLGVKHLEDGTSCFGATIADGNTPPQKPDGSGRYEEFTWFTAKEVFEHHGKGMMSVLEFFDAAYGVTEKTSADEDPVTTGLDAPRTSRWGLMQATGNMWTWGHDGDPDEPRAYYFGGSWGNDADAGSRASIWVALPTYSNSYVGARGRSDHLNLDELAR